MIDSAGPGRARVLVTRPQGQGGALRVALEAAGCNAYSQPLLELRALPRLSPAQRQHLIDLDLYQHVIFVSGNAVNFGMDCIEDYWPQIPQGLTWYAVGDATAARLGEFGIEANTPGTNMSSEGLLALPGLQSVAGQRILIIKGEGGRATLRDELGRREAKVEELACYRRCCPEMAAGELAARLRRWRIQLIMISSGEGFGNLQALLSPQETTKFRKLVLIVPSERVAEMARAGGFQQILIAENASDTAMISALEEWQARENAE